MAPLWPDASTPGGLSGNSVQQGRPASWRPAFTFQGRRETRTKFSFLYTLQICYSFLWCNVQSDGGVVDSTVHAVTSHSRRL